MGPQHKTSQYRNYEIWKPNTHYQTLERKNSSFCFFISFLSLSLSLSSSSWSSFSLCIEINSSHWQSQTIHLREIPSVETLSRSWWPHCLSSSLLEQDEHVPVDTDDRLRSLVAHYFSSCIINIPF